MEGGRLLVASFGTITSSEVQSTTQITCNIFQVILSRSKAADKDNDKEQCPNLSL